MSNFNPMPQNASFQPSVILVPVPVATLQPNQNAGQYAPFGSPPGSLEAMLGNMGAQQSPASIFDTVRQAFSDIFTKIANFFGFGRNRQAPCGQFPQGGSNWLGTGGCNNPAFGSSLPGSGGIRTMDDRALVTALYNRAPEFDANRDGFVADSEIAAKAGENSENGEVARNARNSDVLFQIDDALHKDGKKDRQFSYQGQNSDAAAAMRDITGGFNQGGSNWLGNGGYINEAFASGNAWPGESNWLGNGGYNNQAFAPGSAWSGRAASGMSDLDVINQIEANFNWIDEDKNGYLQPNEIMHMAGKPRTGVAAEDWVKDMTTEFSIRGLVNPLDNKYGIGGKDGHIGRPDFDAARREMKESNSTMLSKY